MLPIKAILALLLTALVWSDSSSARSGIDLHWLWDDRCLGCHGHSADFARAMLHVEEGELRGVHHETDLRTFLHNHYLAGMEVDAVYRMLMAQARTPPRFSEECRRCHDSAVDLVRESAELRDGVLYSRKSGRVMREFLDGHRHLDAADAAFFDELLTRIASEVYRP
ncbi:MAG: hypothetical protein H6959_01840 [Chromatiaceae bacterium]|nr:hypothetical protein [Gammaproteobacteria bacterium]MCP5300889.1 hypothetical protein [Chromatiaceae bacterium]MCP5421638.1 hypothetical protein [Chromatiaceae bacterium]